MRVSCINLDSKFEAVDENLEKAVNFINLSAKENADVVILPELFTTGFFPKNLAKFGDKNGEKTVQILSNLAANLGINIIAGSVIEARSEKFYNSTFIFDKNGLNLARYSKTHLFSYMGEDEFFASGDELVSFTLDGAKCAVVICYDLRFPELIRTLALRGVEVLFVVSAWPIARIKHLEILAQARAIENQIFVILANSCSSVNEVKFGGNSMIVEPYGEILARNDENEGMISANIDLSTLEKIRKTINVYRDRRTDLYQI